MVVNLQHNISYSGLSDRVASLLAPIMIMIFTFSVSAQTDAQLSQYYEVQNYYNSAAIGLTDFIRLRGGARMQWVGIDNAPSTFLVTGDMPFKIGRRRIGLGVVMESGSEGLYRNMSFTMQGAWRQPLLGGMLSTGVGIGYRNQQFKGSEVVLPDDDDYHESSDNAIPTTDLNGSALDISAGVHYSWRRLWVGISCNHINQPTIQFSSGDGASSSSQGTAGSEGVKNFEFRVLRTLYFMAGGNIPIKNTLFEVMPSVFVKTDFTFTRAELTARVRYNRFLSAGLGYRYDDAVSVTLAAEIRNFYIGYSYDYPTSEIARASHGSHEIFAGYSLKLDFSEKNRHRHKSIRLM